MTAEKEIKLAQEKIEKSIQVLKNNLKGIRSGRVSTSLLEHIKVEVYNTKSKISHIANITILDSSTLKVQPWDTTIIHNIEKAIRFSDLGLNPTIQGDYIKIIVPPLNEERRKNLVKIIKKHSEETKIVIRSHRKLTIDNIKNLEKKKLISEDERRIRIDEIQKIIDLSIKNILNIISKKEEDIMFV